LTARIHAVWIFTEADKANPVVMVIRKLVTLDTMTEIDSPIPAVTALDHATALLTVAASVMLTVVEIVHPYDLASEKARASPDDVVTVLPQDLTALNAVVSPEAMALV
jgi:negative regulator of sigma E activity